MSPLITVVLAAIGVVLCGEMMLIWWWRRPQRIHVAFMLGRSRKLRSLLEQYGEDVVHLRRRDGKTTLHCAAIAGNLPGVQYLVKRGVDVDAQDRQGWTALHYAAGGNYTTIIKVLLENGADAMKYNVNGQTPYDVSLQKGFTNASQILQQYVSNQVLVTESIDR